MKAILPKCVYLILKTMIVGPLLVLVLTWNFEAAGSDDGDSLIKCLPRVTDIQGWKLDDTPQTAEGEALFGLINGGAELYVRSGFKKAAMATYTNASNKTIILEIYEMVNSEAAQTVYSRKIGAGGQKLSIGREALLEDYYINFWEGPYQVTLIAGDSEKEIIEDMVRLAGITSEKLKKAHSNNL